MGNGALARRVITAPLPCCVGATPLVRPPTRPHAALTRPCVSERERHVRAERGGGPGRSCMATWTTLGLFLNLILIIILDYLLE